MEIIDSHKLKQLRMRASNTGRSLPNHFIIAFLIIIGFTSIFIEDVAAKTWLPSVSTTGSDEKIAKEKFRKEVAEAHIKWHESKGREFTPQLDDTVIQVISTNSRVSLKPAAARSLKKLIEQARADLAEEQANKNICAIATGGVFLQSGYRDFATEKRLWKGAFEKRYRKTKSYRSKLKDKYGPQAVSYLVRRLRKAKAYPGFSNHSKGLSIDFSTTVQYKKMFRLGPNTDHKKAWKKDTWLFPWLKVHAREYGYIPYHAEPWHWSYDSSKAGKIKARSSVPISCNVYGKKASKAEKSTETSKASKELKVTESSGITKEVENKPVVEAGLAQSIGSSSNSGLGKICYDFGDDKKFSLTIPDDTNVWLARMIHGETGGRPNKREASAMLWASIRRGYGRKIAQNEDLLKTIRGHSQPINPIWLKGGSKCRKYYKTGKYKFVGDDSKKNKRIANACVEKKVKRRKEFSEMDWGQISPVARSAVEGFFDGTLAPSAGSSVAWIASKIWKKGSGKTEVVTIRRNTYYSLTNRWGREVSNLKSVSIIEAGSDKECGVELTRKAVKEARSKASKSTKKTKKSTNSKKSKDLKTTENPFD